MASAFLCGSERGRGLASTHMADCHDVRRLVCRSGDCFSEAVAAFFDGWTRAAPAVRNSTGVLDIQVSKCLNIGYREERDMQPPPG